MYKLTLLILLVFTLSFAYLSPTHKQFIENMPGIFGLTFCQSIPDVNILAAGSISPDWDYPNMKIPDQYLPEVLRPYNTSIVKWEHVLPDDVPPTIDSILKKVSKEVLNKDFKYADETVVDWYNLSITFWRQNQKDSSIYWLGRCCHLIQDITVPMHCRLASGLVDGWNTLKDKEPNHEKFERMCNERYQQPFLTEIAQIDTIKDLKLKMQVIAMQSRKNLKLCDGIGCTWLTKNKFTRWFAMIIPGLAEDYDQAILEATKVGEKHTAELMAQFLRDILNLKE